LRTAREGGRRKAATLALPIGPRLRTSASWDSKGCCSIPSRSEIFGGTRRSVDSPPRKGNNQIRRPQFALARAKRLRRTGPGGTTTSRLHILPDTGEILNTNRLVETPFTPFISVCYVGFKAAQNSPRSGRAWIENSVRNYGQKLAQPRAKRAAMNAIEKARIRCAWALRRSGNASTRRIRGGAGRRIVRLLARS
jgi:hypothetical protein